MHSAETAVVEAERGECPRCALPDEERRRKNWIYHAPDCPSARPKRKKSAPTLAEAVELEHALVEAEVDDFPVGTSKSRQLLATEVRRAFLEAFRAGGGTRWLLEWGRTSPTAFFQALGRLVPKESESVNRAAGVTINIATAAEMRPVIEVSRD